MLGRVRGARPACLAHRGIVRAFISRTGIARRRVLHVTTYQPNMLKGRERAGLACLATLLDLWQAPGLPRDAEGVEMVGDAVRA